MRLVAILVGVVLCGAVMLNRRRLDGLERRVRALGVVDTVIREANGECHLHSVK